jgi:hypothetical protein
MPQAQLDNMEEKLPGLAALMKETSSATEDQHDIAGTVEVEDKGHIPKGAWMICYQYA